MKKLIIIIFPLFLIGQDTNMPENVQKIIKQAKDHYDVSLFKESKLLLLELLHSNEGKDFEAEIRYHLGLASYYDNNIGDAKIQWSQVINRYPTSKRAQELNRVFSNWGSMRDSTDFFREEEFEYSNDLRTGHLFWTPTYMNQKLFWSELKDPKKAILYYKGLADKYEDPKKKFQFWYRIFLLQAGYNSDEFGYGNDPRSSNLRYQNQMVLALKMMKLQITDENIDPNFGTLIQAYYVCGVKLSGSSLFSGSVKVNKDSEIYFNTVIELTENDNNNIYRIFSQHWLEQKK